MPSTWHLLLRVNFLEKVWASQGSKESTYMIVSCLYDFPSYGWKSPAIQRMIQSTWTRLHADILCKVFLFSNPKGNVGALEPRPPKRGEEFKKKKKKASLSACSSLSSHLQLYQISQRRLWFLIKRDRFGEKLRPGIFSNEEYCISIKKFKNIWIYRVGELGEHLLQAKIL